MYASLPTRDASPKTPQYCSGHLSAGQSKNIIDIQHQQISSTPKAKINESRRRSIIRKINNNEDSLALTGRGARMRPTHQTYLSRSPLPVYIAASYL